MPDVLWPLFRRNRHLLHDLPVLGAQVLQQWARQKYGIRLMIVVIPHTFGRHLNFNCHLHILVSEGGLRENGAGWRKRPPRDVDLYFLLPPAVYERFQGYVWNQQSALLQEVKDILATTYPDTDMRGDGQVVLVRFGSYSVEVVPAFSLVDRRYWICDTHNGGSYKTTDPWAEVAHIDAADKATNSNLRPLIRMLKVWQVECLPLLRPSGSLLLRL